MLPSLLFDTHARVTSTSPLSFFPSFHWLILLTQEQLQIDLPTLWQLMLRLDPIRLQFSNLRLGIMLNKRLSSMQST